jgi:superfamily II DNA or RNA helicase
VLRDLKLKAVYRTETDSLLEDFYIPALSVSSSYDRAVGFFNASMLSFAAQGISALIKCNGRMRLIFGGTLSSEDATAIERGYDLRTFVERFGVEFSKTVDQIAEDLTRHRLEALSWMVANGTLDIKVAFKQHGMYHEKIGILRDHRGDCVVFQGSANETASALLPDFNFESVNVFPCWREELKDHFEPYLKGFELLWNNESRNTIVIEFPDAAKEKLIRIAKTLTHIPSPEVETDLWQKLLTRDQSKGKFSPQLPITVNGQPFIIKQHQSDALNAWRSHSFRGILELATGAGKTIAALYGAARLFEAAKRLFLIIAVPYQNLADQWVTEARNFGMNPISCYGGLQNWKDDLAQHVHLYEMKALPFASVVVVNRTLQNQDFQKLLSRIPGESLMFVGDECHYHRAVNINNALPPNAAYRLGLSATPNPYFSKTDSDLLIDYYGSVCYRYDLRQALSDGVLTPYKYFVEIVDLTPEEVVEYERISEEISRLSIYASDEEGDTADDPRIKNLLFRRSRLIGAAANKLKVLSELIQDKPPEPLTLFYCGDGSVEEPMSGETLRQVEAVSTSLYKHGWKTCLFTSDESRETRQRILDNFKICDIDAMVAIRCLDEGIDVPACRTAYLLASSRNSRQFIQRRGRILRRAPGKEYATIYDLIVRLPEESCSKVEYERKLFSSELKRIAEFARLSRNPDYSYRKIEPMLKKYDLEHHFV